MLHSLLSLVDSRIDSRSLRDAQVDREVTTGTGKRLDIVVENKNLIVGIENKIRAPVYNDLKDYSDHLEKMAKRTGQPPIKIILCLNEDEKPDPDYGFRVISYREFSECILKNIGPGLVNANQHYVGLLLDFIATVDNLKHGTHMDAKLLNFFKENEKAVHNFYTKVLELIGELESKGTEAKRHIGDLKLPKVSKKLEAKDDSTATDKEECVYCIWCDASLEKQCTLGLELQIRASGWWIIAWPAEGNEAITQAREFVEKSGIPFTFSTEANGIWKYKEFPYEESPEKVAKEFLNFVKLVSDQLSK